MTTKTRLTKAEKRALSFCEQAKRFGNAAFTIEWVKSRTWGMNPTYFWQDGNAVSVSGCGYDKLSAALAQLLSPLGSTREECLSIGVLGGAGESSVVDALKAIGWTLKKTADSRNSDSYTLTRDT